MRVEIKEQPMQIQKKEEGEKIEKRNHKKNNRRYKRDLPGQGGCDHPIFLF